MNGFPSALGPRAKISAVLERYCSYSWREVSLRFDKIPGVREARRKSALADLPSETTDWAMITASEWSMPGMSFAEGLGSSDEVDECSFKSCLVWDVFRLALFSLTGQEHSRPLRLQDVQLGLTSSHFLRRARHDKQPFLERGVLRRYFVGNLAVRIGRLSAPPTSGERFVLGGIDATDMILTGCTGWN